MNKSKIVRSSAILLVKDVLEAAEYYRDKLGFDKYEIHGEPPTFAKCTRDGFDIMFSKAKPEHIIPHWKLVDKMWNVYFRVDNARNCMKNL